MDINTDLSCHRATESGMFSGSSPCPIITMDLDGSVGYYPQSAIWRNGLWRDDLPLLDSSPPVAGGIAYSEVMRVKEPALPLTSCSTWESGLSTSHGQYARADPVGRGTSEQFLWA